MSEVLELEHLFRVSARDRHETVVPHERGEPALRAFLIDQTEKLALRDGIGREREPVGEVELFGVLLAELRDEKRSASELAGERGDLGLIGLDLVIDDARGSTVLDRGLDLARDRERLDRKDENRDDEERAPDRRDDAEGAVDEVERALTERGDDRTDSRVPRRGKKHLNDRDDPDESDRRFELLGQPDEDVQRLRYRTFEGDRRRGREDPRGEAVARRDEAGAVSAPGRESDERQHNDVDRAEGQVGHAPRMLDAARFRRCRAPPRSREGPEGTGP